MCTLPVSCVLMFFVELELEPTFSLKTNLVQYTGYAVHNQTK